MRALTPDPNPENHKRRPRLRGPQGLGEAVATTLKDARQTTLRANLNKYQNYKIGHRVPELDNGQPGLSEPMCSQAQRPTETARRIMIPGMRYTMPTHERHARKDLRTQKNAISQEPPFFKHANSRTCRASSDHSRAEVFSSPRMPTLNSVKKPCRKYSMRTSPPDWWE